MVYKGGRGGGPKLTLRSKIKDKSVLQPQLTTNLRAKNEIKIGGYHVNFCIRVQLIYACHYKK